VLALCFSPLYPVKRWEYCGRKQYTRLVCMLVWGGEVSEDHRNFGGVVRWWLKWREGLPWYNGSTVQKIQMCDLTIMLVGGYSIWTGTLCKNHHGPTDMALETNRLRSAVCEWMTWQCCHKNQPTDGAKMALYLNAMIAASFTNWTYYACAWMIHWHV